MNNFSRWIRSKQGIAAILLLVVFALVFAVIGTQTGLFGAAGGKKGGGQVTPTATSIGVQEPTISPLAQYAAPQNGYTCLPSSTCAENDGKFFTLTGSGVNSFGGVKLNLWIAVPGNATSFELGIFDGDSGKDPTGVINPQKGNWDSGSDETTYTLFADPLADGSGAVMLASWKGNADNMPNNAWFTQNVANTPSALSPSGHYFYRLTAEKSPGNGISNFKVRSTGYLSGGKGDLVGTTIGIVGALYSLQDIPILYPNWTGNYNEPGISTYSGDWTFFFYVPVDSKRLEIWDGDLDRGTSVIVDADTDDPNTEGKPAWAVSSSTVDERAGGAGAPKDDNNFALYRRSPSVSYDLIDPSGNTIMTNADPSGTEEWEQFVMSTDQSATDADIIVPSIQPGLYTIRIKGLDLSNAVWFYVNQSICDTEDGCGPPPEKEAFCPRTIGYWKNNVKKVLIEGRTNGVQETPQSIRDALRFIAMKSQLYVSGINVADPAPNPNMVPLTDQEAHAILQKAAGNSMLDRALQQNLATWLNMYTGKIGPNTVVVINTPSGTYEGTLMDALLTAEKIILDGDMARMEYAKDIADMINNGQVNMDPEENLDSNGNPVCTIYDTVIPKDKQPPTHDKLPKAPVPKDPPSTDPGTDPDPQTCTGRENQYGVENPTNNPFYGIKFEFKSGSEVKNGDSDIFSYTLPKDVVAGMTSVQFEGKAGTIQYIAEMQCDFTSPLACDPVGDANQFKAQFLGATDNGDGTLTLTFQLWNYTSFGLSHASFSLPAGAVPSNPTNTYTSKVCNP